MKKLKKLSLHHLSQAEMTRKEMNALKGGVNCDCNCICACPVNCPCAYAGGQDGPNDSYYGGSSITANNQANGNASKTSTIGTTTIRSAGILNNAYNIVYPPYITI